MSHVTHIQQQKDILAARSLIIRLIREFFWSKDFLEVEAPTILQVPGQEPYLSPMGISFFDERGESFSGYLHTSPEYAMKKMLAAGFEKIFYLGKCFRDRESFGGQHNPEFTMLEWYRTLVDFYTLMDDVEQLFSYVFERLKDEGIRHKGFSTWKRLSMRELWLETIGVDLDEYLTDEAMRGLCVERGFSPAADERYEDLFFRIFLNEIEPKLKTMGNVMVHSYPAQMAALAKLSDADPRYAERFEVYMNGVELANAFGELTDSKEQLRRLQEERQLRGQLDKVVYDIDMDFVDAVAKMPKSAGIALGVDRLVMVLLGCRDIDDVLVLPMSTLFSIDS